MLQRINISQRLNVAALATDATALLDRIVERLIGFARPPVSRAILESDWKRDARDAYCWRCGDSVGVGEATESGCGSCRGKPTKLDGVVRLGMHVDDLREWVQAIKYERWWEMGEALGRRLGEAVTDAQVVDPASAIVIPMPMPWQRRVYRGIDHAQVIADGVAKRLGCVTARVLTKPNGPPQVSLPATERKRRAGVGMTVQKRWFGRGAHGWGLEGAHFILVDDVRATGASIQAAARLLRELQPDRIVAALVSVSDDTARRHRGEVAEGDHSAGLRQD